MGAGARLPVLGAGGRPLPRLGQPLPHRGRQAVEDPQQLLRRQRRATAADQPCRAPVLAADLEECEHGRDAHPFADRRGAIPGQQLAERHTIPQPSNPSSMTLTAEGGTRSPGRGGRPRPTQAGPRSDSPVVPLWSSVERPVGSSWRRAGLGEVGVGSPRRSAEWRQVPVGPEVQYLGFGSARPTAVVGQSTTSGRISDTLEALLDQVYAFLETSGVRQSGHNVMLYKDDVPNVRGWSRSGGPFVSRPSRVVCPAYRRDSDDRPPGPTTASASAHQAIWEWCAANGRRIAGPRWEIYGDWHEDPTQLETEVYYLLLS